MMSESTVAGLRAAAATLSEAGQRLSALDPGASAFGAGGLGLLGDLGREAYGRFQAALNARAQEARAHAHRIGSVAEALEQAAGGFAGADHDAGQAVRDDGGGV